MRRFPSLQYVVQEAGDALRRFPWVIAAACTGAAAGIIAIEAGDEADLPFRVVQAATLGLPLFVALTIHAEREALSRAATHGIQLVGALLLVGYCLAVAHWLEPVWQRRYVQLSLGLHWLVAFLPYSRQGEQNGFWQYNKSLFIRFLVSVLFSIVLFAGLSIALLAIDKLLGFDVDEENYARLWITIALVFNTWYFVSGVPRRIDALEASTDYPRGLKVFSQYILVPLVVVYLIILTLYLGRVVVTRVWPSGWIGYLVSSVAAAGILSLLLVHPIQRQEENRWIKTYARGFYLALLPAIIMLWLAIWKRIQQYGITENRYFLVVLSAWLAGIALYFILSRARSIKVIPATLCALAIVTSFGPWGAYRVSEASQRGRLEALLTRNGLLSDGKAHPAAAPVSFDDRKQIGAVFDYLIETHGTQSFAGWFGEELARIDTLGTGERRVNRWQVTQRTRAIMEELDLEYVERYETRIAGQFHYFVSQSHTGAVDISDYDYVVESSTLKAAAFDLGGQPYAINYQETDATLRIERDEEPLITIELGPFLDELDRIYETTTTGREIPREAMQIEAGNDRIHLLILFNTLSGGKEEDRTSIWNLQGAVYLRLP